MDSYPDHDNIIETKALTKTYDDFTAVKSGNQGRKSGSGLNYLLTSVKFDIRLESLVPPSNHIFHISCTLTGT